MSNIDVTRDAPRLPQNAEDPAVHIPDSVKRAAAAAEAAHKAVYGATEPIVETPKEPVPDEPIKFEDEQVREPDPHIATKVKERAKLKVSQPKEPVAEPVTRSQEQLTAPQEPSRAAELPVGEDQWEHRYRSMKGRYDASQGTMAQMQEQMTMLGNELSRTQHLMMQGAQQQPQTLITDEDKKAYGDDLIDLTRRAALDAVKPELSRLEQENKRLQSTFLHEKQVSLTGVLDNELPNWREINRDPRFIQWLRLPDIYSGVVRKQVLDAAYQAASAPRVLAFFRGFVQDEVATGNIEPDLPNEQPPAPRIAAVPLERLAAPGRARPAGGNTPSPADDKPIFTRAQISKFYSQAVRQAYVGREKDRAADEQLIFAAQREGRIR